MTPMEIANQAYDKDFRWWFLALLVCVFLAGIAIVRYLVMRAEKAETAHSVHVGQLVEELQASRKHHHDRMEVLTSQYFALARELAAVVVACTNESREVRRYLEKLNGHGHK